MRESARITPFCESRAKKQQGRKEKVISPPPAHEGEACKKGSYCNFKR